MKKYLTIWSRCVRMGYMSTMAYKWNYLVGIGLSLINMATDLLYIWYIFYLAGIEKIAGVDYVTIFFAFGLLGFVRSIMRTMVMDNSHFVQNGIHTGELDEFLMKPVSFKYITSVRFFWPEQALIGVVSLLFLIVISWQNGFFNWGWLDFVWLIYIVFSSLLINFFFIWIVSLLAFYWDRFNQIKSIFWMSGMASYYPRNIYPRAMQWIGIYIFPLFLIVNPVFELFSGDYGWVNVWHTSLYMVVLCIIYLLVWRMGLRKYNSAN